MKQSLIVTTAILALLTSGIAQAAGTSDAKNAYIKLEGGASVKNQMSRGFAVGGSSASKKTKNGTGVFSAGVGLYASDYFRTDLTYNHYLDLKCTSRLNEPESIASYKMKHENVMLTGYYDIRPTGSFTPFLLAGIGYGRNKTKPTNIYYSSVNMSSVIEGKTRTNLVYSLGVGGSLALSPTVDLDLSYRFADLGKAQTGSTMRTGHVSRTYPPDKGRIRSHAILLGMRYSFY
jgi:opacity protein-like surface antigen